MFAILTGSIIAGLFGLVCLALGVLVFVFWIWMLIHAIMNKGLTGTQKIIWVLVIIFLHALGALIYFFLGRPKGSA